MGTGTLVRLGMGHCFVRLNKLDKARLGGYRYISQAGYGSLFCEAEQAG